MRSSMRRGAGRETLSGFQFHHAEVSQGAERRQRAPMRFGKSGHGEPEGEGGAVRMAL